MGNGTRQILSLRSDGGVAPSTVESRTEDIRRLMLSELGEFGEKHYPKIAWRVRYAQDAQGLWYARGDVMAVLSAKQGETVARQKISGITEMFEGLLPGSLGSRVVLRLSSQPKRCQGLECGDR